MRPWHRFLCIAVLGMVVVGCAPGFRLATLSSDQIPADIRERYAGKDVVWRACYEQGGYTIVWTEGDPLPGVNVGRVYRYAAYRRDESGRLLGGGEGGFSGTPTVYGWGYGVEGTPESYSIDAHGHAFTRVAHKVVGEMTNGQKVEGLVVNGFWYLRVDEPLGDWVRVIVQDSQGRALQTFEKQ